MAHETEEEKLNNYTSVDDGFAEVLDLTKSIRGTIKGIPDISTAKIAADVNFDDKDETIAFCVMTLAFMD